jgi:hypothetical protein
MNLDYLNIDAHVSIVVGVGGLYKGQQSRPIIKNINMIPLC